MKDALGGQVLRVIDDYSTVSSKKGVIVPVAKVAEGSFKFAVPPNIF